MRKWHQRRSARYAEQGKKLEGFVEDVLSKLQTNSQIAGFIHNPQRSDEDHQGKDFTVFKMINGQRVEHSFGVTISSRSWHQAQAKHRGIPQFCFPLGTNPETIEKRILSLFNTQ